MTRRIDLLPALSLLFFMFPLTLQAQLTANQVTSTNSTGVQPYTPYGGVRENIGLTNGNLNLQVPLLSLPGRKGTDLAVGLEYDSKIWNLSSFYNSYAGQWMYGWQYEKRAPAISPYPFGWRLNWPVLESNNRQRDEPTGIPFFCYMDFIATLTDGSKHSFPNRAKCTSSSGPVPASNVSSGDSQSADFMRLDSSNETDLVVHLEDGTRIHFPTNFASGASPYTVFASKIEDVNGNYLSMQAGGGGSTQFTDTLGRSVTLSWAGAGPALTSFTYKDSNGQTQTISLAYSTVNVNPGFTHPVSGVTGAPMNATLLSTITLPNNLTYAFQYNTYGEITRMTYPTGGYTRYEYQMGQIPYSCNSPSSCAIPNSEDFREVVARHVCQSSSSTCTPATEYTTTYAPLMSDVFNSQETITDAAGNVTKHFFSTADGSRRFSPREIRTEIYQASSTLLRTITTDYSDLNASGQPQSFSLPIRTTTTFADTGQVTTTEYDYDTYSATICDPTSNFTCSVISYTLSIGNPIQKREFAFGSGAAGSLMRRTDFTWLKTNPVNGSDYTSTAIFIMDRRLTGKVYDPALTLVAQTQYEYDNYAANGNLSASGAVQHTSSFDTSYLTRGNATSFKRWRNTDGAWLSTNNQYDDAGNILKSTDPGGHPTNFNYADSWGNTTCTPVGGNAAAYVTSVTNALTQVIRSTYNSCTGTRASATDLNNQTTTFAYDPMGRLIQTTLPPDPNNQNLQGQTTVAYNEATVPLSVTTTTRITATTLNHISAVVMDGLGRVAQSQLNSDPDGPTFVDTTYDGLGHTATQSNPYRTANDPGPTNGITSYNYDGLGRVTKMIPPDSSGTTNNVTTFYYGNCTTTTEQAGKTRKSCTDALGRLIQLFEPNASGSFVNETDYQYDVLNNLTRVDQKGNDTNSANWRTRTFVYDSLSRLTSATNPETGPATTSGTVTYTYDSDTSCPPANSFPDLLVSKVDPRGVRTCLQYDPSNRVTQKSYSDSTPTVKYAYDGVAPTGCTPTLTNSNPIGHRTAMCDDGGWEAWNYDVLGRPLTDRRSTNNLIKDSIYAYNLDGSIKSLTYPSQRTITLTPGGAGRVLSAADTANSVIYATGAKYTPHGALSYVQNGAAFYSSFLFNNRLQPCWIYVNTSSTGAPANCTQIGVATAGILDFQYDFGLGTADNGNVNRIANRRNSGRSITYQYDELNRIKSAVTDATSGQFCWGQLFGSMPGGTYASGYDPWANLKTITPDPSRPGCPVNTLGLTINAFNKIVDTGYGYDNAGNMSAQPGGSGFTFNAENLITSVAGVTYTYDGDGKRVQKSNGKLYWYGMSSDPLDESDATGNITDEYIFFNGKRIARHHVNVTPPDTFLYYFADHLGTSRAIAQDGQMAPCYDADYYPFGAEAVVTTNTCPENYKFTGKERDSESGLDDFDARYYASTLARFTSPDEFTGGPIDAFNPADPQSAGPLPYAEISNPQSLNKYAYTYNNPLRYTDPNGHCILGCIVEVVAGAVVVAGIVYAFYKFTKRVDKGVDEASRGRKLQEESSEAVYRGDIEKGEQKDEQSKEHKKKALGHAQEALKEGVQIPGTSTGGDIGVGVAEAVGGIITGLAVDAENRELEKMREQREAQAKDEEQKRRAEEQKRKEEEARKKRGTCHGDPQCPKTN